ncbi:hypothetical protein GCM10010507_50880 [Streptomyces cinnamoneus]|uniref:HTH cro/C1-type domain-containing protein n=1 Tax=Streptomyces cinnamoneus TaxID=53446 RepID=A0A918TX77_STRCJ|nr:hypothetical protein GCM10010507_50880 [Streptomyces cinnamoneus]
MNGDFGNDGMSFDDTDGTHDTENVKGLAPLPPGLRHENREFVLAMRRLFGQTKKSLREFAAYHHFSPASVSRYLSGKRLPDKVFVDALLKSACQAHQVPLTPEVQEHAYRLHREALFSEQPARYRLQMESDKLEEAILAREQAELAIRDLKSSVSDQKHELERLEQQKREITRTAARERAYSSAEIEHYRGRERDLEAQCHELREEIDRLEAELTQAEYERDEAQSRCRELEDKLAVVEEDADREELQARVDEVRSEISAADAQAAARVADLQRAEQEAEEIRLQAVADAHAKREEADALFEETRNKAAQAAADFETNLAKRREQSERDLASRQRKAEKRLVEIELQAEQLRKATDVLAVKRADEEARAARTALAEPVRAAPSTASAVRADSAAARPAPASSPEAIRAVKPFWFAVPGPRHAVGTDGGPGFMLTPGTWYLAVAEKGTALIAEDRATGKRGMLMNTDGIQRSFY